MHCQGHCRCSLPHPGHSSTQLLCCHRSVPACAYQRRACWAHTPDARVHGSCASRSSSSSSSRRAGRRWAHQFRAACAHGTGAVSECEHVQPLVHTDGMPSISRPPHPRCGFCSTGRPSTARVQAPTGMCARLHFLWPVGARCRGGCKAASDTAAVWVHVCLRGMQAGGNADAAITAQASRGCWCQGFETAQSHRRQTSRAAIQRKGCECGECERCALIPAAAVSLVWHAIRVAAAQRCAQCAGVCWGHWVRAGAAGCWAPGVGTCRQRGAKHLYCGSDVGAQCWGRRCSSLWLCCCG